MHLKRSDIEGNVHKSQVFLENNLLITSSFSREMIYLLETQLKNRTIGYGMLSSETL